jgi:hypothetical protein
MRASGWVAVLGFGGLLLAGCAEQQNPVNPDAGLAQIQTGAPVLRCRDACLADWRREQPEAQQLHAQGRWRALAALVIRVNYQDDLSLYYLARAAEGLGFTAGAAAYYRQSKELSGTAIACSYLSRLCGGVVLPQAASLRLSLVTLQLEQERRVAPTPSPGKAAPAANEGVATGTAQPSETVVPEPAAIPAPVIPPAPAPPPPRPADARDFIEPPPAPR